MTKRLLVVASLLILIALVAFQNEAVAAPADPTPIEYKQPDGSIITISLKGDEKVSWAETSDGYTLLQNNKGGWEYAIKDEAGNLKNSGVLAHKAGKRTTTELRLLKTLEKKVRFSPAQTNRLKKAWESKYRASELEGTGSFFKTVEKKTLNKDGLKSTEVFTPSGQKKLLMILIEYKDVKFTKTQPEFEGLMNTEGYTGNGAHGSVRDYFLETSYTLFDLTTTVAPHIYTAANNMAHYGADLNGDHSPNADKLMEEAVLAADADGIDFSQYDNDGDGSVDGVYVVFAGYSQATGGPTDAIWPHAGSISPALTCDGKTVSKYSCSNELTGGSGTNITTIGVICHEFGHVCGAPDYYDTDDADGGDFNGCGSWDVMDVGLYRGTPSGSRPSHFNPFEKIEAGWVTPTTLTSPTTITNMPNITSSPIVYKYNTTTADEYFLIENRQQTGFNTDLPGHGLLIYHYSKAIWDLSRNNAAPQGFYPVCARASTSPTTSSDAASYGDISTDGCPFPGSEAKTSFTDATTPSAKSWAGNNSFKPITSITEDNVAKSVSFTFMGGNTCTPPSTQATNLSSTNIQENELTLNWTRGNGDKVIVLARRNSAINSTPLNGTAFNANSSFGAGDLIDAGTYVVYNGTESNVTITDLLKNYTYYFAVYEYNTTNNCYLSPALTGSTSTTGCSACAPTATTKGSFGITNVSFNTINNSSDYSSVDYTNYAETITEVTAGTTYTLSVSTHSYSDQMVYTKAWIDWNNDCTFQLSEEYDLGSNINEGIVTKQIPVPANAYSGYVTMRIRTKYSSAPTPCNNQNYSEAEDYTLKIVGGCTPPTAQATNFTATNIQGNQATINWTRGNGDNVLVIARQGAAVDCNLIGATDFTANVEFGTGAQIGTGNYVVYNGTANNTTITGLTAGLAYHFAVYEYNSTSCFLMPALTGNITTVDDAIWTGTTSTDWFATANWSTGSLPTSTTSVTIPSAPTNQPQINASGAVCKDITIDNGATLAMSGTTAYTLSVYGNWINNGGFSSGIGTVCFQGTNELQTISGSAITTFYILEVKAEAIENIVEATSLVAFPSTPTVNPLKITSGTFKLSSASTIKFPSVQFDINGGLWNNGGTINSTLNNVYVSGSFKNSAGISNFLRLYYKTGASITLEGGSVNISAQIRPNTAGTSTTSFTQTGGTLTFSVGVTSSTAAPFEITSGSSFTMSDGIIAIQKTSSSNSNDYYNLASTFNVTGGTLQIGNASTTGSPIIRINSTAPIYNLTINTDGTPTAKLLADFTVENDVTIGYGAIIDANSLNLSIGGNWTNDGTFTPGTGTVIFNGTAFQIMAGSAETTFNNLTVDNATGITLGSALTIVNGTLLINSGKKLTIGFNSKLTATALTNYSDATGLTIGSEAIGSGSLITESIWGEATIERYMTGNAWHIVSPSATGNSISSFIQDWKNEIPNKSGSYGMMDYNESGDFWNAYYTSATGENLTAKKGYNMRRSADGIVTFTGTLTSGYQTMSLTRGGSGWNCVGNPYTSAIGLNSSAETFENFITLNSGNLDGSYACVYVWNDASKTYDIIRNIDAATYFQAGQGFFVKAKDASSSLQFTKDMQLHQPNAALKSANKTWPEIKLTATDGIKNTSAVVSFNSQMTNGLDPMYDAGLLRGSSGLNIYSRLVDDNGVDFAVQCLPEKYDSLVIPIGVDYAKEGNLVFNAEVTDIPDGCKVILEDKLTGDSTLVSNGNSYSVAIDTSTIGIGRFYLYLFTPKIIEEPTVSNSTNSFKLKAFQADNQILIIGNVGYSAGASLIDINGRKLGEFKLNEGTHNSISTKGLIRGIYLLTVTDAGKKFTTKIAVK